MTAAVELLLQAANGAPVQLPPELARRLLACSNDSAVCDCLGLSLPQRIRLRNAALLQAAQELVTDGDTTWQAAQRLARAVRRFELALLPALRRGQVLPLTPHESSLWRAYQVSGTRHLRSPRKLYSLLQIS
ncbi:hypothetical protein [[Acidovorax] ebreus]|uniref:hypothetical protein n=1 Tax=Diaphorobacter sp. LI3 TaxID=2952886 RepID=UPI0020486CDB|nr:hypothetical protein MRB47_05315 [Diaphorobacter sp. LI3]